MTTSPIVSIVIPSRDRPALLARLLTSISEQELEDFECLVVDDGSNAKTLREYEGLIGRLDGRFRLLLKTSSEVRSGPSFARNQGIRNSSAPFIAYCDDDDYWVRRDHLTTAVRALTTYQSELFFADMQAVSSGNIRPQSYYDPIKSGIRRKIVNEPDLFSLTVQDMAYVMRRRTLHTDTIVLARALIERAGPFREDINYSEDVEMAFRLADNASGILFRSSVSAHHDVSPHGSLVQRTTIVNNAKMGAAAILHAEVQLRSKALRRSARALRAMHLATLAREACANGMASEARLWGLRSLLLRPNAGALKSLLCSRRRGS